MKVISESYLRELFREAVPETFKLEEGQILTPSAAQFLGERRVEVVRSAPVPCTAGSEVTSQKITPEDVLTAKYVSAVDGGLFETKPAHMTLLSGNRLVPKDHPSIVFRGRVDSCQAELLLLQAKADAGGKTGLVSDLAELLDLSRDIMRREFEDTPISDKPIIGLSESELLDQAQDPEKYFGIDHLFLRYDMGELLLGLNRLRTQLRELEVTVVSALAAVIWLEKPDIVQALNRMSTALYVMMLKEQSCIYK